MIKLVLFDFGNVIVVDTEKALEEFFGLDKLPKSKQQEYFQAYDLTETGKKPTSYLMKAIKRTFGIPYSEKQIEDMILRTVLNEPVWKLLQAIKKSGKQQVAIFTNNQKKWPEREAKLLGISLKGVPVFNSSKMGVRKPFKEAYLYVLNKTRFKPEEIVFIDDKKSNIEGARKAGMNTIHFQGDMKNLLSSLKKLGVEAKIKRK